MTDTYTPSQAVAWIATRDAGWAAATGLQRANIYPSASNALKQPEVKNLHAADDLLSALHAGSIVAADAAGDVLPKTKWIAVDAEHLRRARNVPVHLSWLHGVRLDANKVRKLWPAATPAARAGRRTGEAAERDVRAFAGRAIAAGKKVKRGDFVAACQAETRCQRALAEAAYVGLPDTVRVLRGERIGKR